MSVKKKVILSVSIVVPVIVMIVCLILFAPLPMHIDWDSIYDIDNGVVLLAPGEGGNDTDAPALAKPDAASDWKVLQFTDMHLSEKNTGELGNDHTMREFIKAIEKERPDFVVLTGDIITSFRGRARAVQLCEVMEKLGVYWAYNLGNHEGDEFYKLPRKDLMNILEQYPHCLSEGSVKQTKDQEDVWGIGNFVVNLLGEGNRVVQSMIFMDSGNEMTEEDIRKYNIDPDKERTDDYLKESQVKWYEEQVRKVNNDPLHPVKTMLFIHIPINEQKNLRYIGADKDGNITLPGEDWAFLDGVVAKNHEGTVIGKVALNNAWNLIDGSANFEGVCTSAHNSGIYDKMKALSPWVNGLFCGHDHMNDAVLYETPSEDATPIYLAYGLCSGYATYNLYSKNKTDDPTNVKKGYSVIAVHQDGTFDYSGVRYDKNYEVLHLIRNSLPYSA